MRVEVVAIGTELLLGQITDTNSAWLSEQLALAGMDCTQHQTVGDNLERTTDALELALSRADAVSPPAADVAAQPPADEALDLSSR